LTRASNQLDLPHHFYQLIDSPSMIGFDASLGNFSWERDCHRSDFAELRKDFDGRVDRLDVHRGFNSRDQDELAGRYDE